MLGTPTYRRGLQSGLHVAFDLAAQGVAWPQAGGFTTRGTIANSPELVRKYVRAYTEALHLARTDGERTVDAIMKYADVDDRQLAPQSWEDYRPDYALPPYPDPRRSRWSSARS